MIEEEEEEKRKKGKGWRKVKGTKTGG